jgi:hypothetical protein
MTIKCVIFRSEFGSHQRARCQRQTIAAWLSAFGLTSQWGRGDLSPPPEKYSTLDAGCFWRYEWAYPVQNYLYFNANVSVVLWRGSFVDFMRWFWVLSGSGLAVQFGRAWCTLPVSGWVWRRSETASSLGTHPIACSEIKAAMTSCFRIKY